MITKPILSSLHRMNVLPKCTDKTLLGKERILHETFLWCLVVRCFSPELASSRSVVLGLRALVNHAGQTGY